MSTSGEVDAYGVIVREDGNGFFTVELDKPEGTTCRCRASGRLSHRKIRLLQGDRVSVTLSVYDLTKGRITYRNPPMSHGSESTS